MNLFGKQTRENLKYDFPAGLVVFLVALPLCLGIALASGAPLFSGLIAGIVGGIVVGSISGSSLGVSGPAAGLAVIVFTALETMPFQSFLVAVMVGGVIQIIAGYLKFGVIGYYFPNSVIKGMLAGIGVVIFLKQIPHALGYDRDPEGDWKFIQTDGHNTFSEIYYAFIHNSPGAIVISVISLALLVLWDKVLVKKSNIFKVFPGPLAVVIVGVIINTIYKNFFPSLVLDNEVIEGVKNFHLVDIPVSNNLNEFVGMFTLPDFSAILNVDVLSMGLTIAIVASLETLLCVEATDRLDPYKRITPTNRELKAQGIGNMVSGLIGGLPITQVIVRSSANINSGGRTKSSAIIHGFLLAGCVLLMPRILKMIPLASLACILLIVGYKLAKAEVFREFYRKGWSQFLPFLVTVVVIVFSDLLVGIGFGMAGAIFFILLNNYKVAYNYRKEEHHEGEKVVLKLSEETTFLNKASIQLTLNQVPDNSEVTVDMTNSHSVAYDILDLLEEFKEQAKRRNIKFSVINQDGDKVFY